MALGCRGLAFLDPGSPPWWGRSPLPTRRAFADGAVPSGSREQRCCTLGPRGWSNGLNRSDGSLRAARTEGPGVPTAIFAPQSLTETGAHWVLHSFTQQTLPARLPRPGTHGATRTGSILDRLWRDLLRAQLWRERGDKHNSGALGWSVQGRGATY